MKSALVQKVKHNFVLIVSIPRNDVDMALAAEAAGADGIKMHLNVHHYASGTHFGSWLDEKATLSAILNKVKIPVGLLPGAGPVAEPEEIKEARDMGIDFIDSFAHDLPLYLWEIENLGKMLAVNQTYSREQVKALDELGVDIFEATLLNHDDYGKPLTMRDLSLYHQLSHATGKPVVIPTQKKIRPSEVEFLARAGASGIIIGAVVTGKTVDGVFNNTKAFREAIDNLKAGKVTVAAGV